MGAEWVDEDNDRVLMGMKRRISIFRNSILVTAYEVLSLARRSYLTFRLWFVGAADGLISFNFVISLSIFSLKGSILTRVSV